MSFSSDRLVWVDCEMTGLDVERDDLIEIAVIVTDYDLTPLDAGIDLIIRPRAEALAAMGDFEMTGLDVERDDLIEIAVIVTDYDLTPLDAGIDLIIRPRAEALAAMGDFVRDM